MKWFVTAVFFVFVGGLIGWHSGMQSAQQSKTLTPDQFIAQQGTKAVNYDALARRYGGMALPPGATLESAGTAQPTPKPKIDEVDPKTGKFRYAKYIDYEEAKDEWLIGEALRRFEVLHPAPPPKQ